MKSKNDEITILNLEKQDKDVRPGDKSIEKGNYIQHQKSNFKD